MHHAVTKEGCYSKHGQHRDCCYGDNYRLFVAKGAGVYEGEAHQKQKSNKAVMFMWEQQMSEVKARLLIGGHGSLLTVTLPPRKLRKDFLTSPGHRLTSANQGQRSGLSVQPVFLSFFFYFRQCGCRSN